MAAMSRGPVAKTASIKKPKRGTPSSRKHHFEGFSERISKIKIDPIRRARRTIQNDDEVAATFSYFKDAMNEWREKNMSEGFTSFCREVAPLCESLPQIIHYQDRISDLLIQYIEKGDVWSEEPLLSLTAHFARDLNVRFEKHFEGIVRTVSQLAARHQSVEVIEWSFTCLAWLFKYLSLLLVPDLRPVFDLMAPLLGKEQQKVFVTRFAAGALSFLIRKAGVKYNSNKEPLRLVMRHMLQELRNSWEGGNGAQFEQGLMSLFADSMKGIQRGVHSSAVSILAELMDQAFAGENRSQEEPAVERVLLGTLTALVHYTDAETFKPLLDVALNQLDLQISTADHEAWALSARTLFVICGVRRGTRIHDWKPVMHCLDALVKGADDAKDTSDPTLRDILAVSAVVFQYCALDVAIPHVQLLELFTRGAWEKHFLSFCNTFSEFGSERFRSLLLPSFKKFISSRIQHHSEELCVILPELRRTGSVLSGNLSVPSHWQQQVATKYSELIDSNLAEKERSNLAYFCNAMLEVFNLISTEKIADNNVSAHLVEGMETLLAHPSSGTERPSDVFLMGHGFSFIMSGSRQSHRLTKFWPVLCTASRVYGRYELFWESLVSLLKVHKAELDLKAEHMDHLRNSLMLCLGSPSHGLRLAALEFLEILVDKTEEERNIVSTALMIEHTSPTLQTVRSVSMHIRKLASSYPSIISSDWLRQAIPTYLFGLLHVKFTQVGDDACNSIKDICQSKEGEAIVSEMVFEWLKNSSAEGQDSRTPTPEQPRFTSRATEFECTNLMHLSERVRHSNDFLGDTSERMKDLFQTQHLKITFMTAMSRTQALRVLNSIPQVAEKRSRLLVPVLLHWVADADSEPTLPDSDDSTDATNSFSEHDTSKWARKDQKAMLSLFAKFTNPKVLFKSDEVHAALLKLLYNGDVEIQKSALRAILTWKEASINRYEEHLFNLLDDAKFREEISVFMDVGEDESHLQEEDRERVLPIILRLMYGKIISGRRGQEAKRKAVFIALTRFGDEAIKQFLNVGLGRLGGVSLVHDQGRLDEDVLQKEILTPRKQIGFLNMVEDLLTTLKATLTPFITEAIEPLLYCLIRASRGISGADQLHLGDGRHDTLQLSLLRTIRQRAFHSLNLLFESSPDFPWTPYAAVIVKQLVEPRLAQFPVETAQSVSGILRLFGACASSLGTAAFLADFNDGILPQVATCLAIPSAKDEVKLFVLDNILRKLIEISSNPIDERSSALRAQQSRVLEQVLQPHSNIFLVHIGGILRGNPSKDLLESAVRSVAELAPCISGGSEARSMIEIASFLLRQPSKRVNPQTKGRLLTIIHEFIPRCEKEVQGQLFDTVFEVACSLFSFFRDRPSRQVLCKIIHDLTVTCEELKDIAPLCDDLNSFSTSKLDEPDFDRRSKAFTIINEEKYLSFSITQWQPLVYNMLYYIKDTEELSIRVSASLSLRRFVDASATMNEFKGLISSAILPGIQHGMQEVSELVRLEFLTVLAHIVKTFPDWPPVADLRVLLSDDEDNSFFGNVLHIQQHRRLRSLRRLASDALHLGSNNTSHILIPLLEHFVFDGADDESTRNLAGEATRTIGALAESLEWPQYRSILRRYIGYLTSKEGLQKTIVKLLGGTMDSLNRAARSKGYITYSSPDNLESTDDLSDDKMELDSTSSTLASTLPSQEKLSKDITNNILSPLKDFLRKKDDTTVSLRVPVALAVVKVLQSLPQEEVDARLPSILLDVCFILKSKAQEGRDMARNTLADIATLMGPSYLGFVLKGLRSALQKGYQLHVLSFTLHHILVKMSPTLKPGDLDYCIQELVAVIMDDTFGVAGQEKDAEEYISKMKEVKSSKSYDSMDILARITTLRHLAQLVFPVKGLLTERLNTRTVHKIDELLRRIGLGILQNTAIKDRDILVFCYELIQEVYKSSNAATGAKQDDPRIKRFLINMKGAGRSSNRGVTTSALYKITRFSLDILRSVLRKHEELQTPQNLAGFMPILGDALVSGQEEVQISAIRLLTTIIKVPLPALDKDSPVYVFEAVRTIQNAVSTNAEIAQASLKLISAILRERPNVEIKEKDIAVLLKRLLPDLDEPDRQGVTFGFLKAVMARKIVIAEVYEVMDKVAAMMVTNQTRSARDLARTNYFQFLMEYPQAKARFSKQLEFLIRNLRYDYVEGRQSVMEALNLVLTKFGDDVIQDALGLLFIPLIHSMANDDSADCRAMAGALVKKVFERADDQRVKSFISDLRAWIEQDDDSGLKRLAIQCWGLYFEVADGDSKEVPYVLGQLQFIIEERVNRRDEDDWELIYYALTVFTKLCKLAPDKTFSSDMEAMWEAIQSCVGYPHAWVKLTAAKLIGTYFADFASTNGEAGLGNLPLSGSRGLQLTAEDMLQLTNASLKNLLIPSVTEDLCTQSVRNLAFLARCLAANSINWNWQKVDDDDDVEEEDLANGTEENPTSGAGASSDKEEEWGGFSPSPELKSPKRTQPTAIHRLMSRLSAIMRRQTKIMKMSALYPKLAVMSLLETLTLKLPSPTITSSLHHLLTTLTTLTDPATTIPRSMDSAFNEAYKGLIDKAREVMGGLQKKMGTGEYVKVVQEVQKGVRARREGRRAKRKVEAVSFPEKAAKEKRRRREGEKARRKERGQEARGRRRGW